MGDVNRNFLATKNAFVHVCMHVCANMYKHVCNVCMHVCVSMYKHVRAVCRHVCASMYKHVCACVCCVYACMSM